MVMPPPTAQPAPLEKPLKNELGASADFIYAQGTINLPIGFNFSGLGQKPQVISGDTTTEYFGGTASYSYGRNWYVDLSYEHGISTGTQTINFNEAGGNIKANFDYNDDWYQVYFRYNLSNLLKGSKFKAYLRGGFSLVSATLKAADQSPAKIYQQKDDTTDYLGNLGFGLRYSLYSTLRFKVQLQGEAEGFIGERTQNSEETLRFDSGGEVLSTTINNMLYGGLGRGTVHFEYLFGETGRLKMFSDVGVFYKYTKVEYSGASAPSESLWGPYVKVGVSYVF